MLSLLRFVCVLQGASRDSAVYDFAPAPLTRFEVLTGKAGLLGFAGHEHLIQATSFSGRIVWYPDQPAASHVSVSVATDRLEVVTPPDTAEIRKVGAAMREDVLDVAHYPEITLVAPVVARGGDTLHLDIDPKSHPAWTGGQQQLLDRGGRLSRFQKKFAGIGLKK